MIKHILLFRFRAVEPPADAESLLACLYELQAKIAGIVEVIGGPYQSDEGLNHGYTHAIVMTFRDAEARDAYLIHPDHQAAKTYLAPFVQDVVAFDFRA